VELLSISGLGMQPDGIWKTWRRG